MLSGQGTRLVGFQPQWIKLRRASDRPVPLDASVCWRRHVVPMLTRLCRYKVLPRANCQHSFWLVRERLVPSAPELLQNSLSRGFGRRCGACDVGYYGLSWDDVTSAWAVLFLSRVLPALAILAATAFLFYGGKSALPKANRYPVWLSLHPQRPASIVVRMYCMQLIMMRPAEFLS